MLTGSGHPPRDLFTGTTRLTRAPLCWSSKLVTTVLPGSDSGKNRCLRFGGLFDIVIIDEGTCGRRPQTRELQGSGALVS
ncbi:conserved hypothetical protein [Sphingorhabdus sp. 109]|nr:conserved hypothetical protein [Sphingorhabdus sp. 109]